MIRPSCISHSGVVESFSSHSVGKLKQHLNDFPSLLTFQWRKETNECTEYQMPSSWYYIHSFLLIPIYCAYIVEGSWNSKWDNYRRICSSLSHFISGDIPYYNVLLLPLILKCAKRSSPFRVFNRNSVYISLLSYASYISSQVNTLYGPINFISADIVTNICCSH
jgi:hypothetical protein